MHHPLGTDVDSPEATGAGGGPSDRMSRSIASREFVLSTGAGRAGGTGPDPEEDLSTGSVPVLCKPRLSKYRVQLPSYVNPEIGKLWLTLDQTASKHC